MLQIAMLLLTGLSSLPVFDSKSENSFIKPHDAAEDRRMQTWRHDLVSEIELMRSRNRNAGLMRTRSSNSYRMLGLRTFDLMTDPILRDMDRGFHGAAYSSGAMPTLFWWVRIGGSFCIEDDSAAPVQKDACDIYQDAMNCYQMFQIQTFNTMLHQMNWTKLVSKCDEMTSPRCSWHKFLGMLDPYAIDYYSQLDLGMVTSWDSPAKRTRHGKTYGPIYYLPYKEKSCYPIRDIDTLSAVYIYTVCTKYKDLLLQSPRPEVKRQRSLCPNPCRGNPCAHVNYATGSCIVTGFMRGDYECKCRHNFEFEKHSGQCKPKDLCKHGTFCNINGTTTCQFNVTSGQATCLCHNSFMGRRCDVDNNPCVNRMHHPAMLTGNEACRVTGFSKNLCIPKIGTNLYSCICSSGYLPSSDHPYSNCFKAMTPCTKRVCLYGSCIETEDLSNTSCQCEHGFKGPNCEYLKGLWSQWTAWTGCSPSCSHRPGDVTRKRRRVCLGLIADCYGPETEFEVCPEVPECLQPLTPETDALRHMRTWFNDFFLPGVAAATIVTVIALFGAKVLEISMGRLLRVVFERWQMRINPSNTMDLPSAEGTG